MCSIEQFNTDPMTRLVIPCNSPYDVMKYTLNFRSYLPIPNGLEFHSNQTYYFLSTSTTHQQCNKLKIIVHDHSKLILLIFNALNNKYIVFLDRFSPSLSAVPAVNEQERKALLFSHYSHHQHVPSSIEKSIDYNDNQRVFSHIIKAQRHSDPYSIKWITEGPHYVRDSGMYISSHIFYVNSFWSFY